MSTAQNTRTMLDFIVAIETDGALHMGFSAVGLGSRLPRVRIAQNYQLSYATEDMFSSDDRIFSLEYLRPFILRRCDKILRFYGGI
jgi:hypothetical protein